MDKQILQDSLAGMISKGEGLRKDEAIFLKLQGINETIVKTELSRDKNIELLETERENKKDLLAKKTTAVSGSAKKIVEKLNEVLPEKNGVFDCADGLLMGMKNNDDSITAFNGLSGGQEKAFHAALSNVLDANILIVEAAEIDDQRLSALMEDLAGSEKQVIINTCHNTSLDIPGAFKVVEL